MSVHKMDYLWIAVDSVLQQNLNVIFMNNLMFLPSLYDLHIY